MLRLTRSVGSVLLLALAVTGADATLCAQREWFARQAQDAEVAGLRPPLGEAMLEAITVPGEGQLSGLAARGGELLVARGDALIAFEVGSEKELRRRRAPRGLVALAADEQHVYALCGDKVLVLDPAKLEVERELAVPGDAGGAGASTALAVCGERLLLARGGRLGAIEARSGAAASVADVHVEPGASLRWLQGSIVGEQLWGGDLRTLTRMAVGAAPRMATSWPLPADVRQVCGAVVSGRLLLGLDCIDDDGRPRQLVGFVRAPWPADAELLTLKLFRGVNDAVRYELGPMPLKDLRGLTRELQRIAADPTCRVPLPGGGSRLIPVLIEPKPGVRVHELLAAWGVAADAGYEVLYGGEVGPDGWALEPVPPPPPPPPEPPPPERRDGK